MVLNGIDRIESYSSLLKGKQLGLITSVSGTTVDLRSTIQVLAESAHLTALFSPEHGVRGNMAAGEMVETYQDPYTNVPVYSLYRKDSRRFTPEMLENVDAVVYDIMDVGTRYYTFISTLLYAMEDCARYGKELIVLDRFNPLGDTVEGNILDEQYKSFVGAYPLCNRYGLTVGEFAQMANQEKQIGCNLTVIPCENWKRNQLFPDTGNLWVMPSLGIPRFETALIYPGTCLFEGTNLSEGRGTACPFEVIGAPYIDAQRLTDAMREKRLPGVQFSPVYFRPTTSKHNGVQCGGVHIHITDYKNYPSMRVGIELLYAIREMYPSEFEFLPPHREGSKRFIQLLAGGNLLDEGSLDKDDVLRRYERDSQQFATHKKKYHLYV